VCVCISSTTPPNIPPPSTSAAELNFSITILRDTSYTFAVFVFLLYIITNCRTTVESYAYKYLHMTLLWLIGTSQGDECVGLCDIYVRVRDIIVTPCNNPIRASSESDDFRSDNYAVPSPYDATECKLFYFSPHSSYRTRRIRFSSRITNQNRPF